ncbi:MAG TPA: PEP/pyruvate-binding domain-containing protein [Kofleriaceae bacterium]|nr:PEP/pyruvate-binding domain-containing protein [Kofleriaceae bacterium]
MWLHDLRDADASCGGKAVGLAKLIAAGLPVPAGFVLDDRAFRHAAGAIDVGDPSEIGHLLEAAARRIESAELPAEVIAAVERRAAALGDRVMVRSSATIEDGAAGAAAGVFSSRSAVAIADVWAAIRAVWTSALTPLAATYARRRGASIAIGVIVQRFVEGARVTVYTRPPGQPTRDELLVQRGDRLERLARADRADLVRAEVAIGADATGADIELVADWIVQARPIVHPRAHALVPAPPAVTAALHDGRVWTWDVAHNPDPLSIAQQELVARVAALGAWSLRVCAGYLYSAPRETPAPTRSAELIEAELEQLLAEPAPGDLVGAVERYAAFYRVWAGELAPLVAARRPTTPSARPSAVEATLLAAARGELAEADVIARLGVLAPAWDVAVPTFGERAGLLRDAIDRARAAPRSPALPPDPAADLAERDDVLFARAQWLVRRALLERARALALHDRDDVFWIPFADLATTLDPDDAHRRAGAARAAAERAAHWQMPLVIGAPPGPVATALHGIGTGPRVTGRVVRFASLASAIAVGAGAIVVTRAVTPALAVLVAGCAALVSETGGLLDHGAALARELGIPCVVGCADAWSVLADGMIVTVDGDGGVVTTT